MKNLLRKMKTYFTRKQKYVTTEQFNKMLEETGLERTRGLWMSMDYMLFGVKPKNYNNPIEEIRALDEKLDRVIKYLGIEEKRVSEKKYYIKPEKQAKKSK